MHIDMVSGPVYDFGNAPEELHLESLELLDDAVWKERKGEQTHFAFADARFAGNPVNGFRVAQLIKLPPGGVIQEDNKAFRGRQYALMLSGNAHLALKRTPEFELEDWNLKPLSAKAIKLTEQEKKARQTKSDHRWEVDSWEYQLDEGHLYEVKRRLGYEMTNDGDADVICLMIEATG